MTIILLVIGIFFLTSFAAPYKNYTEDFRIRYPDSGGIMGGALFGFLLSWVFAVPVAGGITKASRRELIMMIVGVCFWLLILGITAGSFFGSEPEFYWSLDD